MHMHITCYVKAGIAAIQIGSNKIRRTWSHLDGGMDGEGMHSGNQLLEGGLDTEKLAGHNAGLFISGFRLWILDNHFTFLDTVTRPCTSQPWYLQIEDAFVILAEKSLSDGVHKMKQLILDYRVISR